MFESASRMKLRFQSNKGFLTTEDLWDLNLNSLDTIAKAVNRNLKAAEEESFIEDETPQNTKDKLRLDILKHIIKVKKDEKAAAKDKAIKQAQVVQFKQLLADKQLEDLKGLSVEELEKKIAELSA